MTRIDFKPEAPVRGSVEPAAPLGAMPELFFCVPYRARLTKNACAGRWRKVNGPEARLRRKPASLTSTETSATSVALQYSKCIGCEVGRAHSDAAPPPSDPEQSSRAKHVRLAVVRVRAEAAAAAPKTTAPTSAPKEAEMPKTYTWNGVTKTTAEWAAAAGVSEAAIEARAKKGLPLDAPRATGGANSRLASPPASVGTGGASAKTDKPSAPPRAPAAPRRPPAPETPAVGEPTSAAPALDLGEIVRKAARETGPAALLRSVGFDVEAMRTPWGVVLFVPESAS